MDMPIHNTVNTVNTHSNSSSTSNTNPSTPDSPSTPNATKLILPSLRDLSPRRSSATNSMMDHISTISSRSLSFDVNHSQSQSRKVTRSPSPAAPHRLPRGIPSKPQRSTSTNTSAGKLEADSNTDSNHNKLSVFIPNDDFTVDPNDLINGLQLKTPSKCKGTSKGSKSLKSSTKSVLKKRRKNGPVCSACNREINPCSTMIRCTECIPIEKPMDGDHFEDIHGVIICVECFKIGREFVRHKRFHRYVVIPPLHDLKLKDTLKEQENEGDGDGDRNMNGNSNGNSNSKMETDDNESTSPSVSAPPRAQSTAAKSTSVSFKKSQKTGYKAAQVLAKHNRWRAEEEWNLLYGLRRYGLGNWVGISRLINKSKSDKKENLDFKHVEAHFGFKYGHIVHRKCSRNNPNENNMSESTPNPMDSIHSTNTSNTGSFAVNTVTVIMEEKEDGNTLKVMAPHNKAASVNVMNESATVNRKNSKLKRSKVSKIRNRAQSEQSGNIRSESKFTAKHRAKCGYREHRDEFEAEWNNDAEAMIGEMFFSPYDTVPERELKMEGLRLYNKVLSERKIRKEWVKQHGVQMTKRKGKDAKIEEEMFNNLAVFARYTNTTKDRNRSFSEIKDLVHGLMEEKRLRERIQKLKHYMLNGVTSITVMEHIEKYVEKQKEFATKLQYEDIVDINAPVQSADQFLNRYNGHSLDAISRYLRLREKEQMDRSRNRNKYKGTKWREKENDKGSKRGKTPQKGDDDDDGKANWRLSSFKGYKQLDEGERKLCNILKVKPADLKVIKREVGARIRRHGLLKRGAMPNQIHIDIGDVHNVKGTMTTKIGLVDPLIMPKLND